MYQLLHVHTQPHAFPTVLQNYVFEQLQLHTCNNSYGKYLDSANSIIMHIN